MKKIFYLVLAVVVIGIYSCQKDNMAPAKQGFNSGIASKKKDTTPPDPTFTTSRLIKKDTTPPDPRFTTSSAKRDTTPPDPRR